MRFAMVTTALALLSLPRLACADAVAKTALSEDGKTILVLENEYVRMILDLNRGARVSSFIYKPGRAGDWIGKAPTMGMFLDHVWQQSWPGVLLEAKYHYRVVSTGRDHAEVRVWKTIESGDGRNTVWGVRYERTLSLDRGSPAIFCIIQLTNTSPEPRSPGLWLQHVFSPGGPTAENVYFRPSIKGIDVGFNRYVGKELTMEKKGNDWIKEPAAAWSAVVDPATQVGAVMLVDYNYLRWWYNCLGGWTMEVMYDQVQLPAGKSWQTEVVVLPFKGLSAIAHASKRVLADLRGEFAGPEFRVISAITAVSELKNASLSLAAETVASKSELGRRNIELGTLTQEPTRHDLSLPSNDAARREGVVVRARLTTKNSEPEDYEIFVPPPRVKGAPPLAVEYQRPRPLKRKQYFKPERLALLPHEGFRLLECRGMWFRAWRLVEAAQLAGATVTPSYHQMDVYGDRLSYFPAEYDDLMQLDVIVLSNVTADALADAGLEKVKDFVEAGGGLLVFGGRFAFAGGNYKGTQLDPLLPVGVGEPFSVRPAKSSLRLLPADASPITDGLDWKAQPLVSFPQVVGPVTPDAQVVVKAGKQPFLVTRQVGKGRVAVVLASVEGRGRPGAPLFCEWSDWPKLLANVLNWLRGEHG